MKSSLRNRQGAERLIMLALTILLVGKNRLWKRRLRLQRRQAWWIPSGTPTGLTATAGDTNQFDMDGQCRRNGLSRKTVEYERWSLHPNE